ncbi:putative nucleoside-diphosphate-sugar epimerase [Pedobacter sp. BAL39]|uniref:NmrA family NAD(P)-binding protein n=1 Tax=Pedobacter sp. BAL39 TaxID=391596 RepID=UPI00015598A4|nr:NAD(P)H-binding protein [Pedobacter sp. BAL39]EDM38921.1 putative nucleoside-diphosphate-sugar epimerase [Pedobacter sp. BAL39]
MKKKIVVLGATGTVGSKISEILLNEGHLVTLVARHIEKLEKYRELGATLLAADITDVDTLTSAFKTADAAFVLMPDHVKAENVRAYQREVTGKLIEVIQNSGIKYIVNMSSLGAHMHEGTGIMAGTGEQEVRLNQLADVNVIHIRSAYFMENMLRTIGVVKNLGLNGTAADGDHAIPMVATRDVAKVAAGYLSNLDFNGKVVQAVMGPRDYTLREVTGLIGKAIGKSDLAYVQFPVDQAKQAFLKNGFSEDFVDNLIEMATSIKTGFMNYQKRDNSTTTSTTAEEFVNELYLPAYKAI